MAGPFSGGSDQLHHSMHSNAYSEDIVADFGVPLTESTTTQPRCAPQPAEPSDIHESFLEEQLQHIGHYSRHLSEKQKKQVKVQCILDTLDSSADRAELQRSMRETQPVPHPASSTPSSSRARAIIPHGRTPSRKTNSGKANSRSLQYKPTATKFGMAKMTDTEFLELLVQNAIVDLAKRFGTTPDAAMQRQRGAIRRESQRRGVPEEDLRQEVDNARVANGVLPPHCAQGNRTRRRAEALMRELQTRPSDGIVSGKGGAGSTSSISAADEKGSNSGMGRESGENDGGASPRRTLGAFRFYPPPQEGDGECGEVMSTQEIRNRMMVSAMLNPVDPMELD